MQDLSSFLQNRCSNASQQTILENEEEQYTEKTVIDSALVYQRQYAIKSMRRMESTVTHQKVESSHKLGKRVERNEGYGHTFAGGQGRGKAIAQTGLASVGCATAITESDGMSMSVVSEQGLGNASSWSGYSGVAKSWVGPEATGDAETTSMGSGQADAKIDAGASGSAIVRTRGRGSAFATIYDAGDVFVENFGHGVLRVEQRGNRAIRVIYKSAESYFISNVYSGKFSVEIGIDGKMVLAYGDSTSTVITIPSNTQKIVIEGPNQISFFEN